MFWTTAALLVVSLAFARVSTYPLLGGITDKDPETPNAGPGLFSPPVKDAINVEVSLSAAYSPPLRMPDPDPPKIAGGIIPIDVNNPGAQDALNFAVGEVNKHVVYNSKVVKVISATGQVVSGMLYRFEVEMAISGCKPYAQHKCDDANSELTKPYTCHFRVWSQPWLGPPKLTRDDCNVSFP
ncbi:cystatin-like [Sardina pilchardus]|uniref:cystatin-like n=1 Tax=Sardina pilchardus TaxID=27697 RepID=UPI002E1343D2